MPTIIHDNFDLKKKSLLDNRLSPVATFSSLPDPNAFGNYLPEGATVLVQDTNINYQIQIDPTDAITLIWVDQNTSLTGSAGVQFIELPYTSVDILRATGALLKGAFYKITDRASKGIVVQALETNKISFIAQALYLLADFNDSADYSNTPLSFNDWKGVWRASLESSMINGDVVIWNGSNYQVQSSPSFAGTNPSVNTTAYFRLPKDVTKGYNLEVDSINYDFENDTIIERSDKRGNIVEANGVFLFQWGNNLVSNNQVQNSSRYDCVNNRGSIQNNTLSGSCVVVTDDSNVGTIRNSRFNNTGFTYTCNIVTPGQILLSNCDIYLNENISFKNTSQYNNMSCGYQESNFAENINMNTNFSAGTLTLPIGLNYVGEFTLQNNSGQTISKILNTGTNLKVRFYVQGGISQNFTHTAVGSSVLGNMVADSVGTNNIVGRILAPSDFLEYETEISGILRRYNIVKLA